MRIRSTYASMLLAATAALGLALAGSAWAGDSDEARSAGESGSTMDDASRDTMPDASSPLAHKVQQELQRNEGLKEVRVEENGPSEVTLEGSVASSTEREEAERLARNVEGVQQVQNRIQIGSAGGASDVSSPPPQAGE